MPLPLLTHYDVAPAVDKGNDSHHYLSPVPPASQRSRKEFRIVWMETNPPQNPFQKPVTLFVQD